MEPGPLFWSLARSCSTGISASAEAVGLWSTWSKKSESKLQRAFAAVTANPCLHCRVPAPEPPFDNGRIKPDEGAGLVRADRFSG